MVKLYVQHVKILILNQTETLKNYLIHKILTVKEVRS